MSTTWGSVQVITFEAKQYIQSILEEQKVEGLRIQAVTGCCGPQIGLSLDASEATNNLTLDFEREGEQSGLVMIGASNCC